ncbi:hypothetical protein K439DRAFT_1617692 [Ramaria rubella]|nr:hypothetical protein K439DRAFT_1617692 [Ramaria rubella]
MGAYITRGDKLTPAIEGEEHIVYHEDLLPSVIDYTKTEVILTALERALDLWSDKEQELCGVCENEVHPGVDAELKKTHVDAINLPDLEYSITGDVKAFAHIEWSTFLGRGSLDAGGTDTLAAGLMFGQVISSSLKNKAMDGNFIKPKIRSSISIVTIQMEWEHVTSMLSLVTGNIKLVFPHSRKELSLGPLLLTPAGPELHNNQKLSVYHPQGGTSNTTNWKESYFANEHIPIYSAPHGGKVTWKNLSSLPQLTDDPVLETPVCVVFTTGLFDSSLTSSTSDTISFNVQCVVVLG